ncbi:hypothetical protein ACTMU2_00155 [Cupriavidus basilensis]
MDYLKVVATIPGEQAFTTVAGVEVLDDEEVRVSRLAAVCSPFPRAGEGQGRGRRRQSDAGQCAAA